MAGRRNKETKTTSVDARAFTVVLEEIRAQNKVFGEGLQLLRQQMDAGFGQVDARFDRVDGRLDRVEGRLDGVEGRLDGVEGRLDGVEGRLVGVEGRLVGVEGRLDGVEGRLVGVDGRLGRIENDVGLVKIAVMEHARELKEIRVALEKKVDRDEVEGIVLRVVGR